MQLSSPLETIVHKGIYLHHAAPPGGKVILEGLCCVRQAASAKGINLFYSGGCSPTLIGDVTSDTIQCLTESLDWNMEWNGGMENGECTGAA